MFMPARKKLTKLCLSSAGSLLISSASLQANEIIFAKKIYGPSTNIMSLDDSGKLTNITDSPYWRDVDPYQDIKGNIVFSSNRKAQLKASITKQSDNYNIFYIDGELGTTRVLTESREQDTSPRIGNIKNTVSFIRSYADKSQAICLIDIITKKTRILFKTKNIIDHTWHPEKKQITASVRTGEEYQLIQFDLSSKTSKILLSYQRQNKAYSYMFDSLSWSPDGKWLAYIRHPLTKDATRQLWLHESATLKNTLISDEKYQVQKGLDWSSDSNSIVYTALVNYEFGYNEHTRDRFYQGSMPVFISDLKGNTQQVTSLSGAVLRPQFSPDQKEVAFLYSDKLGDAPFYELRSTNIESKELKTLFKQVSRSSNLIWN